MEATRTTTATDDARRHHRRVGIGMVVLYVRVSSEEVMDFDFFSVVKSSAGPCHYWCVGRCRLQGLGG